jgi:hypothetical protein
VRQEFEETKTRLDTTPVRQEFEETKTRLDTTPVRQEFEETKTRLDKIKQAFILNKIYCYYVS